ncbi:MAG: pyridoxine 5'-phosphate synthase [Verrucomicrobia bacterium]|nr:pyridoxine 5'-phosphate synthase [Verrucomicrobiota bacterium]MBI3870431.1 pyridoxine 5'-phosphate synthase [Verrucomicrobiota bacterium]
MLRLGVNIDHVATLREARYRGLAKGEPDPVAAALQCEAAGAHGITAHLREDRRHLQDRDLARLREKIRTRLNFEMGNTPEMVRIAHATRPDIVCLVPERREEVTTEGGLDVVAREDSIAKTRRSLNERGIEVSLFIAPDLDQIEAAARVGTQFVELHTGAYAEAFDQPDRREAELRRLIDAAELAYQRGVRVNAGHGLTVPNVPSLFVVPRLEELNIGHHIISRSITVGLSAAVQEMLQAMKGYRGSPGG